MKWLGTRFCMVGSGYAFVWCYTEGDHLLAAVNLFSFSMFLGIRMLQDLRTQIESEA